jgi:Sulfotransferase family
MRTVDKMPQNFISLGFIHLCFPNAKIIHCKRNPLDNFISAYQNAMNSSHDYAYDQVAYGKYYIKYLELMDHWKVVIPSNIYESQYEKLTANPETEVRKILEFLGLPWEEACLKFNERKSTVRTFSSLQVRNPINTSSVARWRNYEKYLGPIRSILDDAGISYQN